MVELLLMFWLALGAWDLGGGTASGDAGSGWNPSGHTSTGDAGPGWDPNG